MGECIALQHELGKYDCQSCIVLQNEENEACFSG